ncbi:MAG TPA: GIY-YIG nuclease family protein [Phycisphaerae bacterium]|nr:GIY-YIG nuclease family protein [Phycisphaerae bacterium]
MNAPAPAAINSATLPPTGLYQLWIELARTISLRVGCLGRFRFQPGCYAYTGSAKRNLPARVARHRRRSKKLRWHIDYLLASPHAHIRQVLTRPWRTGGECRWHSATARAPGATTPVPGFGSSDCHCPAHLVFIGR